MGILDAPAYSRPQSDAKFAPGTVPALITGTHTRGYDRRLSLYNLKPTHLRRTRSKLAGARVGTADCRIGVGAHSMGAGVGAVAGISGFPDYLVSQLVASGIPKAGSMAPCFRGSTFADARWSFGSGWVSFGGSTSLYSNSTSTNAAVFTSTDVGTVVEITFGVTSSSGTYSVTIDGGTAFTVTPTGTNVAFVHTVTGLANSTHVVSISRNAAGAGYIMGVEVRTSAKGLRLYNGGIGGQKGSALADANWYSTVKFAAATSGYNADLILLGPIITNDSFAVTAVATWKAQYQTAITMAKANGADVLLILDTPVSGLDSSAYMIATYELADENDLPLLDTFDRWGSYTSANSFGLMSDGTHPNATGYAEWAQAILRVVV